MQSTSRQAIQLAAAFAGGVLALSVAPRARAADGAEVFANNCAPCHGADGKAHTPIAKKLGVKDLTQSKLVAAEIEKQVNEGKRNPRGVELMPPFKGKLSPEEIQAVVTAVLSLRK